MTALLPALALLLAAAPAPPAEAPPSAEAAPAASADVLRGDWPAASPRISVDLDHVRTKEALKRVAAAARWNIAFADAPDGRVDAAFNDLPADQALAAILRMHGLVAERRGDLITVSAGEPASSPAADPPRAAGGRDRDGDRVRVLGSLHVAEGETVRSAVVVMGDLTVDGTVEHDAVCVGGTLRLGPKAVVGHDAVAVGGRTEIAPGARIGHDRVSVGMGQISVGGGHSPTDEPAAAPPPAPARSFLGGLAKSLARYALFFVLGLLLLAFVPERMRAISRDLRRAPGPCTAVGLVGMLALVPLTLLLLVTVVGILVLPFLWLAIGLALLLGFVALALEIGARLPPRNAKRTQVAILGLGVLALFLASQVPVLGVLALTLVGLAGFGAVLRTRFGSRGQDANFVPAP